MAYISAYQYYTAGTTPPTSTNWGTYQYISLADIVNNFMLLYVGDDKLINNLERYNVLFHAKRGIQEINYDALRSIRVLELMVCDDLKFILPPDYVNYVRISVEKNGVLYPLHENTKINYSAAYLQDNNCQVLFDINGDVLEPESSELDKARLAGMGQSPCLIPGAMYGQYGWEVNGVWYFGYGIGGAYYGLQTELANINPSFRIDKAGGVINFSSGVKNQLVVIEYISDGLYNGDDAAVTINKLAEEFLYSYIKWAILNNKLGIPEYTVRRSQKEKMSNLRNAKIRLSNLHPGRLMQNLRGRAKWIK